MKILLLSTGGGGGNILRSVKMLFDRDLTVTARTDPAYAERVRAAVTTRFLDTNEFSLADVAAIDIELSILSPLEHVPATSEAEALAAMQPGEHGVVFAHRGRRATFLPAMWSRFADGRELMGQLKRKAGFPADFWDDDVRIYRYTVDKHVDRAARGGAS